MDKKNIQQAIKFGMVGVLNTAVDYVVFYLMLTALNVDKSLSQIVATAVAMCGSYIINKKWTFGEKGRTKKSQIVKFIVTNIVAMCSTILFINLFHDIFHVHEWANSIMSLMKIPYKLDGDIGIMFCKIMASVFSWAINFLGNKFWVFKKDDNKE